MTLLLTQIGRLLVDGEARLADFALASKGRHASGRRLIAPRCIALHVFELVESLSRHLVRLSRVRHLLVIGRELSVGVFISGGWLTAIATSLTALTHLLVNALQNSGLAATCYHGLI